jgi:aspartate/methionine/tyrosine aminotransferase
MSNTDIKTSELPATNTLANTDLLLVVRSPNSNPTTNTISLNTFRAVLAIANTPANSTALTVLGGTLLYDSNYLYIATANNTVKRVALATF